DLLFPSYGGAENAINVAVEALNQTPNSVHFEVPAARNQRVVFEGRADGASSITGTFVYEKTKGTFGLTRWARLDCVRLAASGRSLMSITRFLLAEPAVSGGN